MRVRGGLAGGHDERGLTARAVPASGAGRRRRAILSAALGAAVLSAAPLSAQLNPNSFDPSDPFAARFREKSRFELRVRKPTPGGAVNVTAKRQSCRDEMNVCTAEGDVVLVYQDVTVKADKITYDRAKGNLSADGHVTLDQGPTRLTGDTLRFNLNSKTGTLENATADLAPDLHVVARRISKVGEETYDVDDGLFTTCRMPDPAWSFYAGRARITLDDYARMRSVTFRARKLPLLYTPYLIWPTGLDRASGFLVPGLGYNNTRGAYLGLTYYWVTGRPTDSTTEVDLYSKHGWGVGQELRWAPTDESAGVFQGFVVRDPQAEQCVSGAAFCVQADGTPGPFVTSAKTRWKLRLDHSSSDLPWDMRGVVSIRDYSDANYLQDFERSFALNATRQIQSTAFLTKNLAEDSFNLRFERSELYFASDVMLDRLPSLEYSHRTAQLGALPLYFAADASVSHFYVNRGPGLPRGDYGRADFHPVLSLPIKGIPWLSLTAQAGWRGSYYTNSIANTATGGQAFSGQALSRSLAEFGASLDGPSFSRIFDFALGPFVKWKHIIEPRVDYNDVSNFRDSSRVPQFDEVDVPLGTQVRYSLVNHFLAKRGGAEAGASQEVATFTLSETQYLRLPSYSSTATANPSVVPTSSLRQPLQAELRLAPGALFNFDGTVNYDTQKSRTSSWTLSAGASWGDQYANFTWSATRPQSVAVAGSSPVEVPGQSLVRAAAGVYLFSKKWRIDTQLNYDAQLHQMAEDRSLVSYDGSCYRILLEVRNLYARPGIAARHDYRLAINLKDIGTLLDLNGGIDKLF